MLHRSGVCAAEYNIAVRLFGGVRGHEKQVLQHIQEQLACGNVTLKVKAEQDDAAVTVYFHRR